MSIKNIILISFCLILLSSCDYNNNKNKTSIAHATAPVVNVSADVAANNKRTDIDSKKDKIDTNKEERNKNTNPRVRYVTNTTKIADIDSVIGETMYADDIVDKALFDTKSTDADIKPIATVSKKVTKSAAKSKTANVKTVSSVTTAANKSKKASSATAFSYKVFGKSYHVLKSSKNYEEKGIASWYGREGHQKPTSSGERFNMFKLTAAHKTLPLSTYVLVTNLKNGKHVVVKINDRGPFVAHRIIDLSYAAAKKIGIVDRGLVQVSVKALS